jgi:hypothetical protein
MTTPTTKKTVTPKLKNTLSDIEKRINDEIEKQILLERTPLQIEMKVKKTLEKNFDSILSHHLGFTNYWAGGTSWEIDSCNENRPIVQLIRQHSEAVLKDLVYKSCEADQFKLSPEMINKIIRLFNKSVTSYECERVIHQHAKEQVTKLLTILNGTLSGASK